MGGLPVDVRTRTTEDLLVSDITRDVAEAVRASGIRDGICCVYSTITTCAIRVSEFETGIVGDLTALVTRLLPGAGDGAADEAGGPASEGAGRPAGTRARCLSMLFGPAGEAVPVADGELRLGTWQRVLLVDFDGRRAGDERPWVMQVVGRPAQQAGSTA